MIFLSKKGADPYVNMLAKSCGSSPVSTEDFDYDSSNDPIVFRGILKKKLIQKCITDKRDFYFIDTGYFGNEHSDTKIWHRIVKNGLQHTTISTAPENKFRQINKQFSPWKTSGSKILIAPPGPKPCKYYNIDLDEWIEETTSTIRSYTDRPIEIRSKPWSRQERVTTNTLEEALNDDVFALVTHNSIASVEAVFNGIPVFLTCKENAALEVSNTDLTQLESPYYPKFDKLYKWACFLAHNQYHITELKNGVAARKLQ